MATPLLPCAPLLLSGAATAISPASSASDGDDDGGDPDGLLVVQSRALAPPPVAFPMCSRCPVATCW